MNHAKKNRQFYYLAYFFICNTWEDKKAPQNTYFMCFHFLYIRIPHWDVRSNRYDFLLPIVVQVYEFHGKSEKLKKALNHHKQESNKKGCVGKFTER